MKAINNNLENILDAVLGKLYPNIEELPLELRSELSQYVDYKLHYVSHAELHAGNTMFMNIVGKYERDPYNRVGDKMFIITKKEVLYYHDEAPLVRIYHAVQDSQ